MKKWQINSVLLGMSLFLAVPATGSEPGPHQLDGGNRRAKRHVHGAPGRIIQKTRS